MVYLATVFVWSIFSVDELLGADNSNALLNQLSEEQISILLKIEDPTFYEHIGISVSLGQGLTTITSSIARDIFLFRHKLTGTKGRFQSFYEDVFMCCKKIDIGRDIMALVLNANLSKEKQLSIYTSNAYMGSHNKSGVIGLGQASEVYYGKPLDILTNKEFIGLVAMFKAPNVFNPVKNPIIHQLRADRIEQVVLGKCQPSGWFDILYEHCDLSD